MQSFKKTTFNYLKTFSTIFALVLILSCSQTVGTDGGGSGGGSGNSTNQTNTEQKTDNQNTNNNNKTDNTENKNNSGTNSGKIQYHTITFEINGGSWKSDSAPDSKVYNNTDLNWTMYELYRNGYVFLGWFRTSDFSGSRIEKITETDPETMTIYARFVEDKPYKITYELNGGYWPEYAKPLESYKPSDSYYYRYLSHESPLRDNYYFSGWYETEDFSGEEITSVPSSAAGEQTYYAKWETNPTITYNLNDGEWAENAENIPFNYTPNSTNYLSLPWEDNVQREGYYFDGWYNTPDFTGNKNTIVNTYETKCENLIFYAKWNKKPSITFILNGGEWNEDAQIIKNYNPHVYSFPLPDTKLLNKKKCYFKGWYETEDFSGKCYYGSYYPKNSTDDKTLYAKWEECPTIEIEYELNGGEWTVDVDSIQLYYEIKNESWDEDKLYLPDSSKIKRKNYYFNGWYDNPEFTGPSVEYIRNVRENQKFYACWKEKPTITYVLNGGEWINPDQIKTVFEIDERIGNLPGSAEIKRPKYNFAGWKNNPELSGSYVDYIFSISNSITLYAKWNKIYNITYELNGGRWSDQVKAKVIEQMDDPRQKMELPYIPTSYNDYVNQTIIKEGYYWGERYYETSDFSDNGIIAAEDTNWIYYNDLQDDKTYYIKWTPIEYRINFYNTYDVEWINKPTPYYTIEEEYVLPTASDMNCNGLTFLGWYDSSGNLVTSIPKGSTGSKSFTAHWTKEISNTITLSSMNDGDNINLSLIDKTSYYELSVEDKYYSYLWKIDGNVIKHGYSNSININKSSYDAGYHNITLVVTDNYKDRTYSASGIFIIQK